MSETKRKPPPRSGAKIALSAVMASRALEHFAAGGSLETFVKANGRVTDVWGRKVNREQVLAAAIEIFTADEGKQALAARVRAELEKIAFANAGDVMTWGPDGVTLRGIEGLTPEQKAAVSEASETWSAKGGSIKLKMHDKVGALKSLGQVAGMFVEKVETKLTVENMTDDQLNASISELLERAQSKAKASAGK